MPPVNAGLRSPPAALTGGGIDWEATRADLDRRQTPETTTGMMGVLNPPVRRRCPVRLPREAYPFHDALATHLPHLRPAQHRGLALWVLGTILAGSACQAAVLLALRPLVGPRALHALRRRLHECFVAGAEKAVPCHPQLDVATCFAPLLRWVLAWWHGDTLPLALDATYLRDRLVVLSVSVLYRGTAIPVAWHVTAANRPGAWLEPSLRLLDVLAPALPADRSLTVLLLADRGLWSPRLWRALRRHGWHPLLRIRPDATFRPHGGQRVPARTLVPGPGHAWVGTGVAYKHAHRRLDATLVVVWEAGQGEPWLVLTDLAPAAVGPVWYGLRTWIELGFRALTRLGWQWQRTRRTDPDRVARHWLVLAVATLWVVATGTREEDAERLGRAPENLRVAVAPPPPSWPARRTVSVFARGVVRLRWQLLRGRRLWRHCWLWPEPMPEPAAHLTVVLIRGAPPLPV